MAYFLFFMSFLSISTYFENMVDSLPTKYSPRIHVMSSCQILTEDVSVLEVSLGFPTTYLVVFVKDKPWLDTYSIVGLFFCHIHPLPFHLVFLTWLFYYPSPQLHEFSIETTRSISHPTYPSKWCLMPIEPIPVGCFFQLPL